MKSASVCIIAMLCAASLGASELAPGQQQSALRSASEHYEIGRRLLQRGEYSAAVGEFKEAQELLEKITLYSWDEASAFAQQRFSEEAPEPRAQEAVFSEPVEIPFADEAAEKARRQAAADRQYNTAVELIEEGRFRQAEEALLKVLALFPKDRDALYNLGVLYENCMSEPAKALSCYVKYLEVDKTSEVAWQVQEWVQELKERKKQ